MFDSERNKPHQRVFCNEIRRLPNETIKQLAVPIETLVRKAYSLNTHDYKNTKMIEILMISLTPQLRKIGIKKRASHPSSIRELDLDFRKLVIWSEKLQINNLQHFPHYLDCQNNHYKVDLLSTSTFKPIPYSHWIKKILNKRQ